MSPVKEPFIDEEGIALGYDEPYGRAERVRQLHKNIRALVEEMLPFENMRWDRMLARDTDRAREAMEQKYPEVCGLSREKRDNMIRDNWRYCQRRKKQAANLSKLPVKEAEKTPINVSSAPAVANDVAIEQGIGTCTRADDDCVTQKVGEH